MFDELKKYMAESSLDGLHVNKATGEWYGGAKEGCEYLTKDEIANLESESPEPESGEEKSTGKKKGK